WVELLDYILRRLVEMGATQVADDIRDAISIRIIEEPKSSGEFGVPAALYKDVGTLRTRPPTAKEVVLRAIEVLHIRLETLPDLSEHTAEALLRRPSDIVWRSDEQTYLFLSNIPEFSGSDLTMSPSNRQTVPSPLHPLIALINQS